MQCALLSTNQLDFISYDHRPLVLHADCYEPIQHHNMDSTFVCAVSMLFRFGASRTTAG